MFDSLILLGEGEMIYHGPTTNVLDYFKRCQYICEPYNNPADFCLDVRHPITVLSWLPQMPSSPMYTYFI